MTFYNLTIPGHQQASLAAYSNRTKVFESIKYILTHFTSVEFIGIFDLGKKKKVNHKNLSIAISLLNENESFGLKFSNENDQTKELLIDITKTIMNPINETLLFPITKLKQINL